MLKFRAFFFAAALAGLSSLASAAQAPVPPPAQPPAPQASAPAAASGQQSVCGIPIPAPSRLPPAGSGPVVFQVVPCFQKQGGSPAIDPATYLYYIQLHCTRPSA